MRNFILALLFCPFITRGQSILDDKKDPFTNVRTITTGINPLYKVAFTPILQVQSQIEVQNDSIITYRLNFVTPGLTMVINNKDSVVNACYLKDENGSIYTGALKAEVAGVVVDRSYQGYTCILTKDDF